MLAQKNRLTEEKDFERVFKQGKGYKERTLYLKTKKNNFKTSRFAFIVSKSFSKKAVERNKIKRRLREIVKIRLSKTKKGLDIVVVVNPGTENDFNKLEGTIDKLFKKAKIY